MRKLSRPVQYLAISVIIHLVFLLASKVFFPASRLFFIPAKPIQVEFRGYGKGESKEKSGSKKGRTSRMGRLPDPKSVQSKVNLKDLAVLPRTSQNSGNPETMSSNADKGGGGSPYAFKNQMTEKTSPILTYLYQRISGNIGYPSDLYDSWIQGDVTAKLRFDLSGKWIDDPKTVFAKGLESRYLRIHVIRRLREILEERIPQNLWKDVPQPFFVETRFLFVIVAPEGVEGAQKGPLIGATANPTQFNETDMDGGQYVESMLNKQNQGAFGEYLLFYHSHLSSKMAWKLGPFAGYGIMPAIGLDPGWFAKTIGDWLHHRAKIDPLEKYRDSPEW